MADPSEKICLEALDLTDADDVFRVWGDFDTVKFTNWLHTPTPEACVERLKKVIAFHAKESRHFGPYCIRSPEGRFLGLIGGDLDSADRPEYELWYILVREEWGKGIASLAVKSVVEEMIRSGRAKKAVATVVAANPASRRVLEKNGFVLELSEPTGFTRHGLTLELLHFGRVLS